MIERVLVESGVKLLHPASRLEEYLVSLFNACDAFITGRGASAIYAALKASCKPGSYVALPSFSCPSIPCAVIAAGFKPYFLDIRTDDFNIDPSELNNLPLNVSALIAPHMFGYPLDIVTISRKCREREIILVEDIAQSVGLNINNRPLGSFGDLAIMSFHPSKIIRGQGGGALIVNTRDSNIHEKLKIEISKLPPRPRDYEIRSKAISARVNGLMNEARMNHGGEDEIRRIYLENLDLIAFSCTENSEAHNLNAILSVGDEVERRSERAGKYRDILNHPKIKHPPTSGTPIFRYSILLDCDNAPQFQKQITEHLRASGIHASNLYYPTHLIFSDSRKHRLKRTESVSRRIINLWLDDVASDEYILKTSDILTESLI